VSLNLYSCVVCRRGDWSHGRATGDQLRWQIPHPLSHVLCLIHPPTGDRLLGARRVTRAGHPWAQLVMSRSANLSSSFGSTIRSRSMQQPRSFDWTSSGIQRSCRNFADCLRRRVSLEGISRQPVAAPTVGGFLSPQPLTLAHGESLDWRAVARQYIVLCKAAPRRSGSISHFRRTWDAK
jgi:hypothetical protein